MKPSFAPDGAIPIPPPGQAVNDTQKETINSIRDQIDNLYNKSKLDNYQLGCIQWLNAASLSRERGIPLPPKPTQPMGSRLITSPDTDQTNKTIWIWEEPLVLGKPCPDLPIAEVVSAGPQSILQAQDMMNVPPGDIMPLGHIETAPDGTQWVKTQSKTLFGMSTFYVKVNK